MAEIITSRGMMDEALLTKVPFRKETPTGLATGTEWLYEGEVVKRDVNFTPATGIPKGSP